ncbi:uncharacterized protein I206_105290 [Kwoniella pini CBS 10737]|uniref:Uncharacterized protein n=1 Tax=Kwoniella pini CBS 10737 TaxID=1296096 RepID=A0A1B9I4L7_9TREE|nr:uncharacterized protein I206_03801 [Kwoniella pini CBS 10737]OCF50477.1 hypothetical protein I206_03801 [Kwoniella pini CBS 10737]
MFLTTFSSLAILLALPLTILANPISSFKFKKDENVVRLFTDEYTSLDFNQPSSLGSNLPGNKGLTYDLNFIDYDKAEFILKNYGSLIAGTESEISSDDGTPWMDGRLPISTQQCTVTIDGPINHLIKLAIPQSGVNLEADKDGAHIECTEPV